MTLDETPRGSTGGGEARRVVPPRSTTRDLERYAGLFARRTQGMKSSAMRDLMAITQRPDVISLAGGQPDTSTFPPESYAALMGRIWRPDLAGPLAGQSLKTTTAYPLDRSSPARVLPSSRLSSSP